MKWFLFLYLIFIFTIPCFAGEKIPLESGYGSIKLMDSFDKVNSTYTLLKIGMTGPFKSNLYVLQMSDPYIKEVDFEFSDNKLVWICIRYNAVTGGWNQPEKTGYGNIPFDFMEGKLFQEYGEPDDVEEGDKTSGGITSLKWKKWIWERENVIMEFEGKCKYSSGYDETFIYTKNLYPPALKEKLKELREE